MKQPNKATPDYVAAVKVHLIENAHELSLSSDPLIACAGRIGKVLHEHYTQAMVDEMERGTSGGEIATAMMQICTRYIVATNEAMCNPDRVEMMKTLLPVVVARLVETYLNAPSISEEEASKLPQPPRR